jgi:putative spermidine/putrescine transport system ATP-binding protein
VWFATSCAGCPRPGTAGPLPPRPLPVKMARVPARFGGGLAQPQAQVNDVQAPREARSAVRLQGVRKRFGEVVAVDGVDLEVTAGEFFSILGPSGSGKTTCLRMIAGFEAPTEGRVWLGGQDVSNLPPYERDVNTVFQDYALFPHMTVGENVEYGLRVKKVPRDERARRMADALRMVRLEGFDRRKPIQLSGGQRQRVALARALVNRPKVLLLDEPLGALDLKLRQAMQIELKQIQQQVGLTFIYVTHDQEEALTMSDRLAVMNAGRVDQVGTPVEVYEQPATDFVAGFIGVSNLLERGGRHFTVRPEKIRMLGDGEAPEPGAHVEGGRVRDVVYVGMVTRYVVELDDGGELAVISQNFESADRVLQAKGRRVRLAWRPDQTVTVRQETEGRPDEEGVGA